jgi:hypothetical protein
MSITLEGVLGLLLQLLPGGVWCAWWLWCVDWRKVWPVLAKGAWLVVVLLVFTSALAWSSIFPYTCTCLGFPLPNFWWQLGACATLALVALFCGWLQGQLGWAPTEVSFDTPSAAHGHHGAGHGHGHSHAHVHDHHEGGHH